MRPEFRKLTLLPTQLTTPTTLSIVESIMTEPQNPQDDSQDGGQNSSQNNAPNGGYGGDQSQYQQGCPQNYGPQGFQQQPARPWYKQVWFIAVVSIVALIILFVGGCMAFFGKVASDASDELDQQIGQEHTVTYVVEGDITDASVGYMKNLNEMSEIGSISSV